MVGQLRCHKPHHGKKKRISEIEECEEEDKSDPINKKSKKSQHFLCLSGSHLIQVRKVLGSRKSLSFTNFGINTDARGRSGSQGSDKLCWRPLWAQDVKGAGQWSAHIPWFLLCQDRLGLTPARSEHTSNN